MTAVYNSQAAAANAQKAAIDARTDAAKSAVGTIPGQTSTGGGSISAQTGTGTGEATLLVARAAASAANTIATALGDGLSSRRVLLLTDISQLSPVDALQFDLQVGTLGPQLRAAKDACESALKLPVQNGAGGQSRFFAPAIGVAIDSVAKLASYFQTDYAFGGVQVTEPSNLTVGTVASALINRHVNVVIPGNVLTWDAKSVLEDVLKLQADYNVVAADDAAVKAKASAIRTKDPDTAAALDRADGQAGKALTQYETLTNSLTATPAAGSDPLIVRVVRGKRWQALLNDPSSVVLLVVEQSVAEYYTKKNLWTFFGGPPLYTMGGIAAAYVLYDPNTGGVLSAGVVPKHGGYKSVSEVQRLFAN